MIGPETFFFRAYFKFIDCNVRNVLFGVVLGGWIYLLEFDLHDEFPYHKQSALHNRYNDRIDICSNLIYTYNFDIEI